MRDEDQIRAYINVRRAYWSWQAAKEAMRLLNPAWLRRYDGPPPTREFIEELLVEMSRAWDAYDNIRSAKPEENERRYRVLRTPQ